MNFNANFFELGFDIIKDLINADANSDITGDRVNLANYDRAYYVLSKPAGTAGDDLSFQVYQHDADTSGNSKALTIKKLWHKVGSAKVFTEVDLTTPSSDFDLDAINSVDLGADTAAAIIVVEVLTESLDVSNGYQYVSIDHAGADVGNALLVTAHWIGQGNRYPSSTPAAAVG